MKSSFIAALALASISLVGCASTPNVAVLGPVGPPPGERPSGRNEGSLRVYSARETAVMDPNAEEFFWNNDFGRNEFLHRAAHTDYTIYNGEGQLIKHVRNARGMNDGTPTLVRLPAGTYRIQALAEESGASTFQAVVPVVVKSGETIEAHLDRPWRPATHYQKSDMVWLPNGRIVGWKAVAMADTASVLKPQPN